MNRQYHGVSLSKKESELIQFLLTGSNDFTKAYYIYKHRRRSVVYDQRKITSWFNKTLRRLQNKGLATNIPFILADMWVNPGVEASKANLVIEQKVDQIREIVTQKPIL